MLGEGNNYCFAKKLKLRTAEGVNKSCILALTLKQVDILSVLQALSKTFLKSRK